MCEWVEPRHGKGKFQFLIGGDHKYVCVALFAVAFK